MGLFTRNHEIEETPEVVINLGDIVEVDGRLGRVEMISFSPYVFEEDTARAFVVSLDFSKGGTDAWTDWCLPQEMILIEEFVQATA